MHLKDALIHALNDDFLLSKLRAEEQHEEHHLLHHSADKALWVANVVITPDFDVELGDFRTVRVSQCMHGDAV
jgi:hypothetical protein